MGLCCVAVWPLAAAAEPQLLVASQLHEGEVPADASGVWWALCDDGARSEVVPADVRVREDPEPMFPGDKQVIAQTRCATPKLLLRDIPGMLTGRVARARMSEPAEDERPLTASLWDAGMKPPPRITRLRFGAEEAVVEERQRGEGYAVGLVTSRGQQTVYETPASNEGRWDVLWAGDLNGDGRLDLLLDATDHYNVSVLRLLLSGPDGRVSEVATFRSVGC